MDDRIIATSLQPDDLIWLDLLRPALGHDTDGKGFFFSGCRSKRKGSVSGHDV